MTTPTPMTGIETDDAATTRAIRQCHRAEANAIAAYERWRGGVPGALKELLTANRRVEAAMDALQRTRRAEVEAKANAHLVQAGGLVR